MIDEGLLDTSVFVAAESGRSLAAERLPRRGFVCAVTVAELQAGVLAAPHLESRARRLATSEKVASFRMLPIDTDVAHHWARLRVALAEAARRSRANDLWIAAVASAHGLPVVTQDSDFDGLAELGLVEVVKV